MPYDFLQAEHPIYQRHKERWARAERLLRGGPDVVEAELQRFLWEDAGGENFKARKRQAVYPGFPDYLLTPLVGHVLAKRPDINWGTLGELERADGQAEPSQAEQIFYNINGTGGDGAQFWGWLAGVWRRAGATGHRWLLVEAPPVLPRTRADELTGARPYAVEFSPLAVTDWAFERGQLAYCVIRITEDTRRVEGGKWVGEASAPGYYLLVRRGYTRLGAEFAAGGWWRFDKDRNPIQGAEGRWDKTAGEIPMVMAYWEADEGTPDAPALSAGAIDTLGNLSVAYMNHESAARNGAWRAAGAITFLLGVTGDAYKIVKETWEAGSPIVPVPATGEGTPQVAFSSAAVADAQVHETTLQRLVAMAERIAVQEATSTPDSSGASKQAGFLDRKAPRLVQLAENMETAINSLLRFFELRFGHAQPSAYVQMPRDFDLAPVEQEIRDFFDTFRRSELRAPTLEAEAMLRYAEAKGLVTDEMRDAVRAELEDSARGSAGAPGSGLGNEGRAITIPGLEEDA